MVGERIMPKPMSIDERRNAICDLLKADKALSVEYLSAALGSSAMTIRRDLRYLSNRKLIQRVHGGAAVVRSEADEPPYTIRERDMPAEKQRIGAAAASLVRERDMLLVDIGSTLLSLVRSLPLDKDLTIVTHWLPVIWEIRRRGAAKIIFLGGEVRFGELCVSGGYTAEMLQNFHADKLFLGVAGLSPAHGLTDYNPEEVQIKRQMIKCAKQVIVLADHSKFDRVAPLKIANLTAAHQIVTDAGLAESAREDVGRLGVELVVAPAESPGDRALRGLGRDIPSVLRRQPRLKAPPGTPGIPSFSLP
jgi:DeoR/GlpR family transcriptional regulator of sugar metabolism